MNEQRLRRREVYSSRCFSHASLSTHDVGPAQVGTSKNDALLGGTERRERERKREQVIWRLCVFSPSIHIHLLSHQHGVLKVCVHKNGPVGQRVRQVGAPEVGGGHNGLDEVGA